MKFLNSINKKTNSLLFPSTSLGVQFLCLGLFFGFLIRLFLLWLVDYDITEGDASLYILWADNILKYGVFGDNLNPSVYRPPLYSFFIASISWVFGFSEFTIQIFQFIINLVSALLITRIAAILLKDFSHWVFLIMIVSPFEAAYAGALISEVLTSFFLLCSVFSLIAIKGRIKWFMCGIFIGLCCLTRDSYLLFGFFLSFFVLFFLQSSISDRLKNALILVLCSILVVAPWTFRNYQVTNEVVPVSEGRLGLGVWLGTWAIDGEWSRLHLGKNYLIFPPEAFRNLEEKSLIEGEIAKGKNHVDMEDLYFSLALKRMKEEPLGVLKTYILRSPNLWFGTRFDLFPLNKEWFERETTAWYVVKSSLWGLNFILICLSLLGFIVGVRRKDKVLIVSLPILYIVLVNFPLNSYEMRYSYPALPYIVIFACLGLSFLKNILLNTSSRINKNVI